MCMLIVYAFDAVLQVCILKFSAAQGRTENFAILHSFAH